MGGGGYPRAALAWKPRRDKRRVLAAWTKLAGTPPEAARNSAIATVWSEPRGNIPQVVRRRGYLRERRPACVLYVVQRGGNNPSRWIEMA